MIHSRGISGRRRSHVAAPDRRAGEAWSLSVDARHRGAVRHLDPFAAVAKGHVDLVQAEAQDVVLRAGAGRQKSHTLQVEIVEVPPGGVSAAEDFWGRAAGSTGREGALKHEGTRRRVAGFGRWRDGR